MKQKRNVIFKALESFPRVELEDIRQYFGADVPTKVRKPEFVDRLGAYIIEGRLNGWAGCLRGI